MVDSQERKPMSLLAIFGSEFDVGSAKRTDQMRRRWKDTHLGFFVYCTNVKFLPCLEPRDSVCWERITVQMMESCTKRSTGFSHFSFLTIMWGWVSPASLSFPSWRSRSLKKNSTGSFKPAHHWSYLSPTIQGYPVFPPHPSVKGPCVLSYWIIS